MKSKYSIFSQNVASESYPSVYLSAHPSKRSEATPSEKSKPPLILISNNGSRIEICIETPKHREMFRNFVQFTMGQLDSDIQKRTLYHVDSLHGDPLRSFSRYFYEGWLKHQDKLMGKTNQSYRSEGFTPETLKSILNIESPQGKIGLDFGCGNGEVVDTLTKMGCNITGFDLSPFFIQEIRNKRLNARVTAIDQKLAQFENEFKVGIESQSFAMATLVLDRLSHPMRFLHNFFQALKPGGSFAIQTLLPIIPKDDGPVKNPIIYTLPENQITQGRTTEEDKRNFTELLRSLSGENVSIVQIPYSVTSLDGIQNYDLWSFNGHKALFRKS